MAKIRRLKTMVYVAGPMAAGNTNYNIRTGMRVCDVIARQGFAVFNPFLTHFWDLMHPQESNEFWMEQDFAFLRNCDIFVRIVSPLPSEGADREELLALRLGIPVLYWEPTWKHIAIVNEEGEWVLK